MKIHTSSDFKTTEWSGGKTTEMFIYPDDAKFSERNFLYRISVATINISSSDFTPLPGVNRTLLLLEGELKLIHENHHESFLMPFSQDSFKGEWQTHSVGIAKDFNLMTKDGCNGTVSVITNDFNLTSHANHTLLFAYDGNASINGKTLKEGELAIFMDHSELISLTTEGKAIMVEIDFVN
jgi:environmental stress-induced protein Ves